MANFMASINKGLTTINAKTNTLVETTKLKSSISRNENEIASLMKAVGETVYANGDNFSIEMVSDLMNSIKYKYDEIEVYKAQISEIAEAEKIKIDSLGVRVDKQPVSVNPPTVSASQVNVSTVPAAQTVIPEEQAVNPMEENPGKRIFCMKCGAPNETDSLFCEQCGARLTE